ncbi:MAG: hypothetical protein HWD58_12090 [Bacteroidota bacterium]|nr:MAG: hypothetical protein HWD58_12090 [Bacteroidota bacterium]
MTKYFLVFLGLGLLGFCAFTPGPEQRPKLKYAWRAFFGCMVEDSSSVEKNAFDILVGKKLCAKDSAGNLLTVESFTITYAERGLYQDSTGLPIIITEYSTAECKGDTIPAQWIADFRERSYRGDTVYFDRVMARSADQKPNCVSP